MSPGHRHPGIFYAAALPRVRRSRGDPSG